jgi:hypothetical protein
MYLFVQVTDTYQSLVFLGLFLIRIGRSWVRLQAAGPSFYPDPSLRTNIFSWEGRKQINKSMERSPASSCSVSQEILRISWTPRVHHRVHKSLPVASNVTQTSSVCVLPSYFFKALFNYFSPLTIRSSNCLFPSGFLTKALYELY